MVLEELFTVSGRTSVYCRLAGEHRPGSTARAAASRAVVASEHRSDATQRSGQPP